MKRLLKLFSVTFLFLFALVSCQQGFTKIEVDGEFSVVLPESRTAGEGQLTVQVVNIDKNEIAVSKDVAIKEDEKEYTVEVKGIPVGINAVVNAIVKDSNGNIIYLGTSDSFKVKTGENECPPITLTVPTSHVTIKIDKKDMIYRELIDAYGKPIEIVWYYFVDDLPQRRRLDTMDELLSPKKELKNVAVPIGEHNITVMAEIKYEKGYYERWTCDVQKANITFEDNKDLIFSDFTNEPIPSNFGRITFTSNTATVSEESPLVLYLSDGNETSKEVTITSFPTTIGWIKSGNCNVTVKEKNKEETLLNLEKPITIQVNEGNESIIDIKAQPLNVYYVDEFGDDTNVGTKASPYATVSGIIDLVENKSNFTFNKGYGDDNRHITINVFGNIKEKNAIEIKKGYKVTIQGTKESPATITAISSTGSGEADHGVMYINEYNGTNDATFQIPTVVILKNIKITGGNGTQTDSDLNSSPGGGIYINRGTLKLGEGVEISGNTFSDTVDNTLGNGIYVKSLDNSLYTSPNVIINGNVKIDDYIYLDRSGLEYPKEIMKLEPGFSGSVKVNSKGLDRDGYAELQLISGVTKENYRFIHYDPTSDVVLKEDGKISRKSIQP